MRAWIQISVLLAAAVSCSQGVHQYASTIRPPAFPLAVRQPYSNYWLAADTLPGHWPTFWEGTTKGWTGLVRVDDKAYIFMGNPKDIGDVEVAVQKNSYISATQTLFVIQAGSVELNVTFNSPVEYEDIQRQSIPLSYVFITARPTDGQSHKVEVYMDISAEWASSHLDKIARWSLSDGNQIKTWTTELEQQYTFAEAWDYAEWGQAILTTTSDASHKSGSDLTVRSQFVQRGSLDNGLDTNFRCISCDWPVLAFAHDLGSISGNSKELQFVVGHIRDVNINDVGNHRRALWTYYYNSQAEMITAFFNDATHAKQLSDQLDDHLLNAAHAAGGQDYVDIIVLSLRQAFAGTEFSGTPSNPILYQKEISSNGNMQTVDVMYPAVPMWYYMNPKYLRYLLEPLFYQMENGLFLKEFAMHDIGQHFPNATGYPNGDSYDMPVEESANMLLMVATIAKHPKTDKEDMENYIRSHYDMLSKWANYLKNNCLYPVNQLTTDDFIGHTELNSGLALKGILGMKAYAVISDLVGQTANAEDYHRLVDEYIPTWLSESMHNDGTHLKMEYNVTDGYQFKYNAYFDKLLNFSVVPQQVYDLESEYYMTKTERYGTPFVNRHDYTKSDWEMWTAAAFGVSNPALRTRFIENMGRYLRETPSRAPFPDWYVTNNAVAHGFKARPVAGGHFSLLSLTPPM